MLLLLLLSVRLSAHLVAIIDQCLKEGKEEKKKKNKEEEEEDTLGFKVREPN